MVPKYGELRLRFCIFLYIRRLAQAKRDRYDASAGFGVWRSLVARSVRVGEVLGSNPGTPIVLLRASEYRRSVRHVADVA